MSVQLPTLDKSREHGVVFPPESDAHFFQDGFYFSAAGRLVEELIDDAARARLKKVEAKKIASAAAKVAIKEALVDAGFKEEEAEQIAEEDTSSDAVSDAATDAEVDLVRWAKGTRKYLWSQVAKAAKAQHSFGATSKAGLITFLVEEKRLLSSDEVRV